MFRNRTLVAAQFFQLWIGLCLIGAEVEPATNSSTTSSASTSAAESSAGGLVPKLDLRQQLVSACFDCHGNGSREGEFAIDELLAAADTPENRGHWEKVWKLTRQGFMPPVDAGEFPAADREQLVRTLAIEKLGVDFENPDPGRVTMRRLTRLEFEHSINDLFGIDTVKTGTEGRGPKLKLRELLPPDDIAHGFDNIGDFQTMPPSLLEKYFEVAEQITAQLIVTDPNWQPVETLSAWRVDTSDTSVFKSAFADRFKDEWRDRVSGWEAKYKPSHNGASELNIEFSVGGWQEYSGQFDLMLLIDGNLVQERKVNVGGEEKYEIKIEHVFDKEEHRIQLLALCVVPDYQGKFGALQIYPDMMVKESVALGKRKLPESHRRIFFKGEPPEDTSEREMYARDILGRIVKRAFRKPVDANMLDALTGMAMAEENFFKGVSNALTAILTSPRFLYRTELQPQPDAEHFRHDLNDFELASRLSYFLWLSLPDDELLAVAEKGELRSQLDSQMARMMADEKSSRFIENFAGQWLRNRNVLMAAVIRYRQFDPYRKALKQEADRMFEHIVREDVDMLELITADYSFLNDQLARFYGVDGVSGSEFRKVHFKPEHRRGGLLTQGGFLVATSNPDRTSPVKRGLFVLENLLATEPPPPPANVPALEVKSRRGVPTESVRKILEQHREDAACAACHAHFDPIGLVLENYDSMGKWRDEEAGEKIDTNVVTVTGEKMDGIDDLKQYFVTNKRRFYQCCAEKLMTYALGRGIEPFDSVTIDAIAEEMMENEGRFSVLLKEVVHSPAFLSRRGNDD